MKVPILYLGNDQDFCDSILEFALQHKIKVHLIENNFSFESLQVLSAHELPQIIFVDFTSPRCRPEKIFHQINKLRQVGPGRSVVCVALFKDLDQRNSFQHIYVSGFQLSFQKGIETTTLLRDSFFLGLKINLNFPILARANCQNLRIELGLCSSLVSVTSTDFTVDTHLSHFTDFLNLHLPLFPTLERESFEILGKSKTLDDSYQQRYRLKLPYANGWEDDESQILLPDTVETWLDFNQDQFKDWPLVNVFVVSQDLTFMEELNLHDEDIVLRHYSSPIDLASLLRPDIPSMIFLNLDDDPEGPINLSLLEPLLLNHLPEEGYRPIVVVSNCPSTGQALQKIYNYPLLLAMSTKLSDKMINHMVAMFLAKKSRELPRERSLLKPESSKRMLNLKIEVQVTSITEHEITFFSDLELSFFAVLHSTIPLNFYCVIVPSIQPLKQIQGKYHYMAFINNLSEDELEKLRVIVNQLIFDNRIKLDDPKLKSLKPEKLKIPTIEVKE